MKQIDFFYFFGSGYAYLSVMRIAATAKQSGVAVRWRPFNVRTVMAENNIALRTQAAKVKSPMMGRRTLATLAGPIRFEQSRTQTKAPRMKS